MTKAEKRSILGKFARKADSIVKKAKDEERKEAYAKRRALLAMIDAIKELDLGHCFTLVNSDLLIDLRWVSDFGSDRFYWAITDSGTGIGQDPEMTVDHYRECTPSSVVACFLWDGWTLHRLPNKLGEFCAVDDRDDLPRWGKSGGRERVQL